MKTNTPISIIKNKPSEIIFNGNEYFINTYQCSSCKTEHIMEVSYYNFCPNCGVKYLDEIDISI